MSFLTLGIETSCDECASSVVVDGKKILSSVVASQIEAHRPYGGVVPEIASREHLKKIVQVADQSLIDAKVSLDEIKIIGVTQGPGLIGSLLVGLSFAKAISLAKNIPLVGVDHVAAHLFAVQLEKSPPAPPFVGLVVSGGHTSLYLVKDHIKLEMIGATKDDAAGEAFDKVAKFLGLSYPGGISIELESQKGGNPRKYALPRPMLKSGDLNFSFSGLKTALLNLVRGWTKESVEKERADLCASFQEAVVDVLVEKCFDALEKFKIKKLVAAGGVAANARLREVLKKRSKIKNVKLWIPSKKLCTDNAAMVAALAYFMFKEGMVSDQSIEAYSTLYRKQ